MINLGCHNKSAMRNKGDFYPCSLFFFAFLIFILFFGFQISPLYRPQVRYQPPPPLLGTFYDPFFMFLGMLKKKVGFITKIEHAISIVLTKLQFFSHF